MVPKVCVRDSTKPKKGRKSHLKKRGWGGKKDCSTSKGHISHTSVAGGVVVGEKPGHLRQIREERKGRADSRKSRSTH